MREITREELYEMVWSEPTVQAARALGVSDVTVGKLCKKMAIPKPPIGYWAKKAAGKPAYKSPLPKLPNGKVSKVVVAERPGDSEAQGIDLDELKRTVAAIAVERVSFQFRNTPWNIAVSKGVSQRAESIAGAIDKALSTQGVIAVKHRDGYRYEVFDQKFAFRVHEKEETVVVAHKKPDLESMTPLQKRYARRLGMDKPKRVTRSEPTGKLVLSVEGVYATGLQQTWSDTRQSLEEKVPSIIVGVMRLIYSCQAREEARREQEKQEFARRKPVALRTLRKEHLTFVLGKWRGAFELRRFISEVEQHVGDRVSKEPDLREWLEWLRAHANENDPIASERFFMPFSDEQIANEASIGNHIFKRARPWEDDYDERIGWFQQDDED